MSKSKSVRMAFWKYDLFPYILCGEVDEKHSTGDKLYIPSFQGMVSRPGLLFTLSIVDGKKLEESIRKIKIERRREERELHEKYMSLLNDALGEYGLRSIK